MPQWQVVGEMSVINAEPRTATIVCGTDVNVLEVNTPKSFSFPGLRFPVEECPVGDVSISSCRVS